MCTTYETPCVWHCLSSQRPSGAALATHVVYVLVPKSVCDDDCGDLFLGGNSDAAVDWTGVPAVCVYYRTMYSRRRSLPSGIWESTSRGHTQGEGQDRSLFVRCFKYFARLLRWLPLLFIAERGPAVPFPCLSLSRILFTDDIVVLHCWIL